MFKVYFISWFLMPAICAIGVVFGIIAAAILVYVLLILILFLHKVIQDIIEWVCK